MPTTQDSSTAAAPEATIVTKAVVPDAVETAAPAPIQVTLDEFCMDLSRGANSVELIAGFHHVEAAKGRLKQTAEAFTADFQAFCAAEPARPARPAPIAPAARAAQAARSAARR